MRLAVLKQETPLGQLLAMLLPLQKPPGAADTQHLRNKLNSIIHFYQSITDSVTSIRCYLLSLLVSGTVELFLKKVRTSQQ